MSPDLATCLWQDTSLPNNHQMRTGRGRLTVPLNALWGYVSVSGGTTRAPLPSPRTRAAGSAVLESVAPPPCTVSAHPGVTPLEPWVRLCTCRGNVRGNARGNAEQAIAAQWGSGTFAKQRPGH